MLRKSPKAGFSLVELIIVIAVIAALGSVIIPAISRLDGTAHRVSVNRSVQLWNSAYLQAAAGNADYAAVPDWETASTRLISGVEIRARDNLIVMVKAPVPEFADGERPEFTPGLGLAQVE